MDSTPLQDRPRLKIGSRKVRIVGKIRAFTKEESENLNQAAASWITICKPQDSLSSEKVTISFADQSSRCKNSTYELDYCFEQNEDMDVVFSREIKPLITEVFAGRNASVIAYGARGSGKTYAIQGSMEKPGLAVMSMAEILARAAEKRKTTRVSFYEVCQDQAYDVLDPNHEIQILKDSQGKLQLKGLSQVPVESLSEFQNMYFSSFTSLNSARKATAELPRRKHRVLTITISSPGDSTESKIENKINFVDLAGYEDARLKTKDGSSFVDITRHNKSLYALMNVLYALSTSERHVPFRESKLTHMLQESLGGRNYVLLLACMNPTFCQDTIHITSLASRPCQNINKMFADTTKKGVSSAKVVGLSSVKKEKSVTTAFTTRKQMGSAVHFPVKKSSCISNGRKLFDEKKLVNSGQAPIVNSASECSKALVPKEEETPQPISILDDTAIVIEALKDDSSCQHNRTPVDDVDNKAAGENAHNIAKENQPLVEHDARSPPLSERLRELSNSLKSLYASTPLHVKVPEDTDASAGGKLGFFDVSEPKTPIAVRDIRPSPNSEIMKYNSPWEMLSQRSSGMKHCLVQEYLKFLNTANKEELKGLRGIGEKRATYILELREESPEPFKSLDDLENIGLSAKQVKGMMRNMASGLFS